jgi:hypothetical protein
LGAAESSETIGEVWQSELCRRFVVVIFDEDCALRFGYGLFGYFAPPKCDHYWSHFRRIVGNSAGHPDVSRLGRQRGYADGA